MANSNLEEFLVRDATIANDPIELHIIRFLQRLRHQNKRLKDHIKKTGAWASIKDIESWRPFDFYHYFCVKYQERYGSEYRQSGNIVLTYKRIDEFRVGNNITKQKYRDFIDKAFEKHFNKINVPRIGHVCSSRLYNYLMKGTSEFYTAEEFHDLDRELIAENEKFEEAVKKFNKRHGFAE